MNYHEIVDGHCAHCDKFRLSYEIVNGLCSRSKAIRKLVHKPSIETIKEHEKLIKMKKRPQRSVPGWNK